MNRKIIICVLTTALLSTVPFVEAQQPGKISRIGILNPGRRNDVGIEALSEAFRQGLKDLGYVEGKNLALEYRFAEAEPDRLREIAAEFVRLKVDVIFTINTPASRAAKNVTQTIPIVFTWVADPLDLVASLARPGGNITGLTSIAADLSGKRLELLKEALSGVSRVGILWNSANPTATRVFKEMEEAGPRLGIRITRSRCAIQKNCKRHSE